MLERGIVWAECWIKMMVLVSRTNSQLPPCFCSQGRVQHNLAWLFESIFFDFWSVFVPVCRLCFQPENAPLICQGMASSSACSYWKKSQKLSVAKTDKLGFGGLGAVASYVKQSLHTSWLPPLMATLMIPTLFPAAFWDAAGEAQILKTSG